MQPIATRFQFKNNKVCGKTNQQKPIVMTAAQHDAIDMQHSTEDESYVIQKLDHFIHQQLALIRHQQVFAHVETIPDGHQAICPPTHDEQGQGNTFL